MTKKTPFIVKNNFQFIVDFCQSRKYENKELNFKTLSIQDRVLLSVYMTGLMNKNFTFKDNNDKKIKQMCNIVFNFNGRKREKYVFNKNIVNDFKKLVKQFFENKKEYYEYVEQDVIILCNDKKDLFKISLNPTEYMLADKLKFKNVNFLLDTIYILGTAKNHTSTILNRFDVHNFSHCLSTSRRMLDRIFKLMGWHYKMVYDGTITWKSKWKKELVVSDLSKEDEITKKIMEYLDE